MKSVLTLLLISISLNLSSQILEDKTQILDDVGGETLFSLKAGEKIYTYEPNGGWYKIRKRAFVDPSDLMNEEYIAAGISLKNEEGEIIGEVMREIKVKDKRLIEGFRNNNKYVVILQGYVFKTRIEEGSIPEERISELLNEKNRNTQFAGFEELFDDFNFEERQFGELTAYAFRDENFSADEENDFRVIMVFRGQTSVYAIITNDHTIEAPKVKDKVENGDFTITYLYKPSNAFRELVEDKILYTFVSL